MLARSARARSCEATVHRNDLAGDPAGVLAGQERDDARNVPRLPDAPKRSSPDHAAALVGRERAGKHRCIDDAGCDGIDCDSTGTEFCSLNTGYGFKSSLGRCVGHTILRDTASQTGRYMNHAIASIKVAHGMPCGQDRSIDIDVEVVTQMPNVNLVRKT